MVAAVRAHRLWARLLIVLAIVPTALIAPAPPVRAAPPAVPFSYTSAANAPVGIDPQGIATADLNGESKQDLVVANCFSNSVSVLLGNGGGFAPAPGSPIAVGCARRQSSSLISMETASRTSRSSASHPLCS